MITKDDFIKLLHNLYWDDPFINDLFTSIAFVVNKIDDAINTIKNELFFDTMVNKLPYFEKMMKFIVTSSQTLDDRRSRVRARWQNKGHCSVPFLQNIANCWKNGATEITLGGQYLKVKDIHNVLTVNQFQNKKIEDFANANTSTYLSFIVNFISTVGIPADLESLKKELEISRPAHIPIFYRFKYLLVKDIHNVMTVNQLQSHKIDDFAL